MSRKRRPDPSLLVIACFSRYVEVLDWAQKRLCESFGSLTRISPDFSFHHTDYYEVSMGSDLKKRLLVFGQLRPSDILPEVKNFTIGIEEEALQAFLRPEERVLNLDPGILQLGKFLLATTKDQGHRIFLRDGIFAEVTLRFTGKSFEVWPWTYADYREESIREFLNQARQDLYQMIREIRGSKNP